MLKRGDSRLVLPCNNRAKMFSPLRQCPGPSGEWTNGAFPVPSSTPGAFIAHPAAYSVSLFTTHLVTGVSHPWMRTAHTAHCEQDKPRPDQPAESSTNENSQTAEARTGTAKTSQRVRGPGGIPQKEPIVTLEPRRIIARHTAATAAAGRSRAGRSRYCNRFAGRCSALA
jgi:hypothetical protein